MRQAAEDDRLDQQERGVGGDVRLESALQRGVVEQQRLLRRPGERAARLDAQPRLDAHRVVVAAIDFLGRLGGGDGARAGADRQINPRAVAARHAAAGVDDHRLAFRPGAGKAQPEPAGLEGPRRLRRARPRGRKPLAPRLAPVGETRRG